MSIDATKLGQVSADLMELLGEDDEGSSIGEVLVIVEVHGTDEEGEDWTGIQWRCSDPRLWIQRGLLHAALGKTFPV